MGRILTRLGYWFFCKINQPIHSVIKVNGKWVCLNCGKCHGSLKEDDGKL